MIIKILGSGCKNCMLLHKNVEKAIKQAGIEAEIIKVTDVQKIMAYGIMSMPAIVIDEKVVSSGRILKPEDIVLLIKENNHY